MTEDFWDNIAYLVRDYLINYKGDIYNLGFTEDGLVEMMKRIYNMGYQRGQLSKEWL